MEIKICEERSKLLISNRNLIILGGPGSGKTTIALLKANKEIESLLSGQKILFLSFAKATVARVQEGMSENIDKNSLHFIEISTYHGFFWNILRCHGYLLNEKFPFQILTSADQAIQMAYTKTENKKNECEKIFWNKGLLSFDLFAPMTKELLSRSKKLRGIVSKAYPIIIVDEFQDTNLEEWENIKLLGKSSRIIALADINQRIYEFRGADPERVSQFFEHFNHDKFDFEDQNNRSAGTDINIFGIDILNGRNLSKCYNDVEVICYPYYGKNYNEMFCLKTYVMRGRERLQQKTSSWSIGILLPTKYQMLQTSNYFSSKEGNLPKIDHDVSIDSEGPELTGILFATLLERKASSEDLKKQIISHVINHLKGCTPNKQKLFLAQALEKYLNENKIRGKRRLKLIEEIHLISDEIFRYKFIGSPLDDWQRNLEIFQKYSKEEILKNIITDVKYVRLLHKGSYLREKLNLSWRKHGYYYDARKIFQQAIQKESFSSTVKNLAKINIMTIHKSKGKQFNEVFLFEGFNRGRFIRNPRDKKNIAQSRLMLRVAVTRAKNKATILTPKNKKCEIL